MYKFIAFVSVLFLCSCAQEIEIDQPFYQPKIVVDGVIESGAPALVYLTMSSPFLNEYDSVSIRNSFLNYAKVTVSCSNGDSEVLMLTYKSDFFPPFVYRSNHLKGIVGEEYTLKVEVGNRVVTAVTTIPRPPEVLDFAQHEVADTACYYQLEMAAHDTVQYLYVQMKSIVADNNMHPASIPFYKLMPAVLPTNVVVYRSDETNLYLESRSNYFYSGWPSGVFSLQDSVIVKVGTVDVVSYQILKSLYADQSMLKNPFAFNSAGIQTNVVGGIGRWMGVGLAPTRFWPN